MTHPTGTEKRPVACPCGRDTLYLNCCGLYHNGSRKPETAENLMRARYSAYFLGLIDFLVATTHPDTRSSTLERDIAATIKDLSWNGLSILGTERGGPKDKSGVVEFVASYLAAGKISQLHERSRFRRFRGDWNYVDARG